MNTWTKTSADLRFFNGLVQYRRTTGNGDVGIFRERHPSCWSVRIRHDGDCWEVGIHFTTKHEAVAYADKWYEKVDEEATP